MSHTMNANSFQFGGKSLSAFDEAQERKESIKILKEISLQMENE